MHIYKIYLHIISCYRKIKHILIKFKYIKYVLLSQISFGNFKKKFLHRKEHYFNLLREKDTNVPSDLTQQSHRYAEEYENLLTVSPDFFGTDRYCNICGYRFSRFSQVGVITLREGKCPVCGSVERQRHMFIHLAALYPFLSGKKVLHFAPEPMIKSLFLQSQAEYYDADIVPERASYQVDITDIPFENDFFDYIICSHVLEHIPDDGKAMRELHRILNPHGVAYLCVPLIEEFREDLSVTDPKERERLYGQNDHVRFYNREVFLQRLNEAGFDTSLISDPSSLPELYSAAKIGDTIILARKLSK